MNKQTNPLEGYEVIKDTLSEKTIRVGEFLVTSEQDEMSPHKTDQKIVIRDKSGRIVDLSGSWLDSTDALLAGIERVKKIELSRADRGGDESKPTLFTYKVTKLDKAKDIICALWNMDKLPDETNKARWADVKRLSRLPMAELDVQWALAKSAIAERLAAK